MKLLGVLKSLHGLAAFGELQSELLLQVGDMCQGFCGVTKITHMLPCTLTVAHVDRGVWRRSEKELGAALSLHRTGVEITRIATTIFMVAIAIVYKIEEQHNVDLLMVIL